MQRTAVSKKDNGFTLLELLLTITLIAIGFVFLLQALSIGLFARGENENEVVALNLAQEKLEELRNKGYSLITSEARAQVSGFPAFQRETAAVTPQTGLKQVSVTVYWLTKGSELNVTLVTYVSDI